MNTYDQRLRHDSCLARGSRLNPPIYIYIDLNPMARPAEFLVLNNIAPLLTLCPFFREQEACMTRHAALRQSSRVWRLRRSLHVCDSSIRRDQSPKGLSVVGDAINLLWA